ncbi:MAG TPA: hypothetical protein VLE97_06660 [Gaiellaceae bacterium]|nr:hypothetical protein [Gaiellaceae bacterium]
MTLSKQQIDALRYASDRHLYAEAINEGNGNKRRSLLSLFKLGLLAWDPIYQGRAVLTPAGKQALDAAREIQLAAKAKRGVIDKGKLKEIAARSVIAKQTLSRVIKEAKPVGDPPGVLRIRDVGDRRVITLTCVHEGKP